MEVALGALEGAMSTRDYSFTPSYPYFTNTDRPSPGETDATGDTSRKNSMGATFSLNLLHHDPGVYPHNRLYC